MKRSRSGFGNYTAYYTKKRLVHCKEDHRVNQLHGEWFKGKRCLDVGCNSGKFTLQLSHTHGCCFIRGIDIDPLLIEEANLHSYDSVEFLVGDFTDLNPEEENYDAITMMSVTKWIHLNHGDDGLVRVFNKVFRMLVPGGYFIVEPQPWPSYRNHRKDTSTTATYFKEIQMYPKSFSDVLQSEVGFILIMAIQPHPDQKKGFQRPILVFRKPP